MSFSPPNRYARSGFTLIEVMITLAILMLATAVVVPSLSKGGLAELKSTAGKVAGTITATYAQAALSGRAHRLVFDLDAQKLVVEADKAVLQKSAGLASLFALGAGAGGDEDEEASTVDPPRELLRLFGEEAGDGEVLGREGLADFADIGRGFAMPAGIRIMSVWVAGMAQPSDKDTTYLRFWPSGFTDEAMVHLCNEEGVVFTVEVAGLTGATKISASYVEVRR